MFQIQIPSLFRDLPAVFTNCLVVLVVTLLVLLLLVYWKKTHPDQLPPGPWKLPLIGNLHQLALAGSLPHHSLRDLAKIYGPIMHLKLGQVSAVAISSPQIAQEVLNTHGTAFSGRPVIVAIEGMFYNLSGIASSPYNDYWKQMRKICVLELLSAKRVQSFASIREEEASNLVQSIYAKSYDDPINLSEMIFSMINSITARAAFGKRCNHQQEFTSLIKEINELAAGFDLPDLFPSLKFLRYVTRTKTAIQKVHRKMDKILGAIIDDHKLKRKIPSNEVGSAGQEEDLVNVLLQVQASGELPFDLTIDNIKAITLDMYAAGSETTATTVEWAMSELVRNPRAMEKAQFEVRQLLAGKRKIHEADIKKLDYLKLVIKETLRLHPPLALIPRQATQGCKVSGYDVPTGVKVLVNAWAIGRDPKYWGANADCFEPERFQGCFIDFRGTNFEFIPFGAGKRICPGISFGTAALELALSQLLYFFNWKLPNGTKPQELDMTEAMGMSTRKRNELNVIAIPFIV